MKAWVLLSLFFIGLHGPAHAYDESFPEFTTLNELEQAKFDNPGLMGAEYQSDVYSFQKPWSWQYQFLSKDIAFDTTFGSVSAVHFLMDTRLKLKARLTDTLEFRLLHFDERNHDREAKHTIFELAWFPWKWLGLSGYGEPSYTKRENDVGLALLLRPAEDHEIRLYNTWVDLTRQRRNDRNDTFDRNHLPYARGVTGRVLYRERQAFLEYSLRQETGSKWDFPDNLYSYRHRRELAALHYSQPMSEAWRLNLRLQADRKFEARDPTSPASTTAGEAWTTSRLLFRVQAPLYTLLPSGYELIPTYDYALRRWDSTRGKLSYHDSLLGLFLKFPPGWYLNYSATHHGKKDGQAIGQSTDVDGALNQRLDVGYSWIFSETGELRIQAGFDLDKFGTKETWEAGGAQFRWAL